MSFFDTPAPPEPESEPEHVQPVWAGPPRGVLPAYSPQRAVIFKTDQVMLIADRFLVYPTGVVVTVSLSLRKHNHDLDDLPLGTPGHRRRHDQLTDEVLRFGILFGDGSKWTNLDWRMPRDLSEPDGPFVMQRGGGGGGHQWEIDYWIWPLPVDGPLTFVASWPAFGVAESTATVNGSELRQLAEAAEVIWPS